MARGKGRSFSVAWTKFSTRVPGKWILAGEHSVLRGGTAVALPHPEFALELEFEPGSLDETLRVEPSGARAPVREVLETAREFLQTKGIPLPKLTGWLRIRSTIPTGAGLGSSAAFSVAMARWVLSACALSAAASELALAREMENRFHGKSSGLDVSVSAWGEPVRFSMEDGARPLSLARVPKFSFYDTGLRAETKECIQQVEAIRRISPLRARDLDQEMERAVERALEGLQIYARGNAPGGGSEDTGLRRIAEGMNRAQEVFRAWLLVPEAAEAVIRRTRESGALAARLTGAGGGGFVVALER